MVFGKAHKVAGGESQPPRKVLSAPMRKLDKPPHPLKLVEILDWCVQYSEPPAVGRCKLDPGLKAPPVSKFDCEKYITLLST